jgi:glycosyltransferase involved in cell wall biosynthesis
MRVLHVITTGERRGAEMFAADLIRGLNGAGIEQLVAVLHGSRPVSAGYEAPTEILAATRVDVIPGLHVDPRVVRRLMSICRRWRPDVIQAHGGDPFTYAALAGRRDRIVYRRIGLSPPHARRTPMTLGYRLLMSRSRKIIAVAEAVRRETIEVFGVPATRVVTIPRGVDRRRVRSVHERGSVRRRLGIPADAPVVLSLGALSSEKDPIAHLHVMERVRRTLPLSVHLIAGDGPLRGEVERRAREHRLDGLARILGNRSDVAELLAASDVLLLASRSEGMPGCLIEAGMAGLPVVSYAVAGAPEVVIDNETGYLVPLGDVNTLADRVVDLLHDPALRARMGAAARSRCDAEFDIAIVTPRYLSIYEEVRG